MFENTLQGPGGGTYLDHTLEILFMLIVAFLLGLLLGYILWYKWKKLYEEMNAEHNRLKAVHLDLEKNHTSLRYQCDESEKENGNLRRKISMLEGDITGLKFRLEQHEADIASAAVVAAPIAMAAKTIVAPVSSDDLKKVEGIGPKIEGLCNDIGIRTFATLAATSVDDLRKMLDDAGPNYRIADPETWPKQADLAANGKWDELKEYQDQLSGGREPGQ